MPETDAGDQTKQQLAAVISPEEISEVADFYNISGELDWIVNKRGLVNRTFQIANRYFLTIYSGRDIEEVDAMAQIANSVPDDVPISRPMFGRHGFVLPLESGPTLLTPSLPGDHHVGIKHTDKHPIPSELHIALAEFFWRVQRGFMACPEDQKQKLRGPSRSTKGVVPEILPEIAEPFEEFEPEEISFLPSYRDLIHDDMERQNILSRHNKVTGLVDLDSIHEGDILYEFGHFLFNIAFCDPKADMSTAVTYIKAAHKSGVIEPQHIPFIYPNIYKFVVSDLIDFEDLNQDPTITDERRTDLKLLSKQYRHAIILASRFFKDGLAEAALQDL